LDILRGKRLEPLAPEAVEFTSSAKDDPALIGSVIKINLAHMVMLTEKGIVPRHQGAACLTGLLSLPPDLQLDPALEDVHMNIEAAVVREAGEEAGGQLNLGKSRNDQVATALRMVLREHVLAALTGLLTVRSVLLDLSEKHRQTGLPGYTHLQHAQPVTLAHHLLAHHDAFERDTQRLFEAFPRVNLSPMGAAALATSTIGVDRRMVASLLGFEGIVGNSIDAVSARDFALEVLSDLALLMTDVSRLAEELILWSTEEFGMVEMPDTFSSTSSIMPQKKNPVVAELLRAKASTVHGCLFTALSLLRALPYSYNLDLQELTPSIWRASDAARSSLKVLPGMLSELRFKEDRLHQLLTRDDSLATDVAEHLSTRYGIPFRTAHQVVGALARRATESQTPFLNVVIEELEGVLKQATRRTISLDRAELRSLLRVEESIRRRATEGGPSPDSVDSMIDTRRRLLKADRDELKGLEDFLRAAELRLSAKVSELQGGERQ